MGSTVYPTPSSGKTVKGQLFNSNGNWTAPTGVNYVTVYAMGGGGAGGGAGANNNGDNFNGAGSGGDSAFGTNLVIAPGGSASMSGQPALINAPMNYSLASAASNSGLGGISFWGTNSTNMGAGSIGSGYQGGVKTATVAVTPGSNYSVNIGSGGPQGSLNGNGQGIRGGGGGSGYISLEWEE